MNEPMFSRDIDAAGTARRRFVPFAPVATVPAASAAIDPVPAPAEPRWRAFLRDVFGLDRPAGLQESA